MYMLWLGIFLYCIEMAEPIVKQSAPQDIALGLEFFVTGLTVSFAIRRVEDIPVALSQLLSIALSSLL